MALPMRMEDAVGLADTLEARHHRQQLFYGPMRGRRPAARLTLHR